MESNKQMETIQIKIQQVPLKLRKIPMKKMMAFPPSVCTLGVVAKPVANDKGKKMDWWSLPRSSLTLSRKPLINALT